MSAHPSVHTYVRWYGTRNNVCSLCGIVLIRILGNFVTQSTTIPASNSLIVHIAPCLQELWLFVYENSPFKKMSAL